MNNLCYKKSVFYYSYSDCAYIEDNYSKFHYACIEQCSQDFYNALLERGWRRFGNMFFTPFCDYCNQCISIRQLVNTFKPTRSQKRVLNKNKRLIVYLNNPSYSDEKKALYAKYHRIMSVKKDWKYHEIDETRYCNMFVDGANDYGKELTYYLNNKLVGVAFVDILESTKSMSALYFFYDHDYANLSLGIFSILKQLQIAKSLDLEYFYPGYWIANHYSLGYKNKFKPFEVLINRPELYEQPLWQLYED